MGGYIWFMFSFVETWHATSLRYDCYGGENKVFGLRQFFQNPILSSECFEGSRNWDSISLIFFEKNLISNLIF